MAGVQPIYGYQAEPDIEMEAGIIRDLLLYDGTGGRFSAVSQHCLVSPEAGPCMPSAG